MSAQDPLPSVGELPPELTCRPMGFVVLTDCDILYNAVHKAIWDSFSASRRPDRVPLSFRVLPGDHEYPKCRSKQRSSYEWYIPKGILKTGWMNKHLNLVPALVVIFFDLDWDEAQWKEKQMECASRVEVVRHSLSGRGTKVAVVLIQKNAPLPPGEDMVAAERAAALCSACDLSAKSLFVLPHTDHLFGYTIRLENAFYELAQAYYHTEGRRVKAHKEFLNKTTHQLLFVRHAFKIAFFNELKQDTHTALKGYKVAYSYISELRTHDTNMLEIKTISGFINYKICKLSFQHNAPLDAISQFRKHVDYYKNKTGCPELAFEHSAWMCKQFQIFGDLFDEAIRAGLNAIQTQHPGFYYQQSANHAINRKQLCKGLCHSATSMPDPNPLEDADKLEYFGQRPWRQGHQSIDPPDPGKEKEGIQALQYQEVKVDHSWIIIPLLSSAVAQFKKYKSARMKRYLMVQMGEEYYHAKDYNKGLTLLDRVTWDYRNERWWGLLTSILTLSLRCAYLVASIQEYVTISLELIGRYARISAEDKTHIQMNLIRVISNNPPEPEAGCPSDSIEQAKARWKEKQSNEEPAMFTVEMQNIVPFVECKATFSSSRSTADSPVVLEVYLRALCQFPIRFSKLSALLSNTAYNEYCTLTDGKGHTASAPLSPGEHHGDLYLTPGQVRRYTFQFVALPEDVGKKIEIKSIALTLGSEDSCCAILHWSGAGGDAASVTNIQEHVTRRRGLPREGELDWDFIYMDPTISIVPRPSNMDIQLHHNPPALMNEFYCINIVITNNEASTIDNLSISCGLKENQDATLETTTQVFLDEASLSVTGPPRIRNVALGSLQTKEKVEKKLYIRALETGSRSISIRTVYQVKINVNHEKQVSSVLCTCFKDEYVVVHTVLPYDVSIKLASLKFETIEHVHSDEPFLLLTDIKCSSPWPVTIETSHLSLSNEVNTVDQKVESQLTSVSLKQNEGASECFCLMAPVNHQQTTVPIGHYSITWKRTSCDDNLPAVQTILALPSVMIENIPLFIETNIPSHGRVRDSLPVEYTIYNRTPIVQEIEAGMEPSEAFMFSGHKQVCFRMLPSNSQKLTYNLYPLVPGYVKLPRLHISMPRYPGVADDLGGRMLPTHIFIKPQGREGIAEIAKG
ncbi:trafficking protein particle complex subunit 11-like isoform X1 [Ptychodera flava]|uniref:trafficking protein particle complex subunit 11-like isoform X1 n=1 Tax=Ptychodera flava TaxID=63121 RepID=UPI00396A49FD